MRRRLFHLFMLILLFTTIAETRDFNLPPGKWWENPRLVEHIQLTGDQQEAIRELVYQHAQRMVDLNAHVERAKLSLENEVDQEDFMAGKVRKAFIVFQDARRELELERFEMLLSVRQLLSAEQWNNLLDLRERLENMRQRRDRPNPQQRYDRRPPGDGGF